MVAVIVMVPDANQVFKCMIFLLFCGVLNEVDFEV